MNLKASVIIPVYNDPEGLQTTVESLLDQTRSDFEILICDNDSTDETSTVASDYAKHDRIHHLEITDVQSSYAARNAGIEAACGDVLVFLDADTWVDQNYVEVVVDRIESSEEDILGSHVEIVGESTFFARYNQLTGFPIEQYIGEEAGIPTNCLTIHKRVIDEIGKFESRLISSGDSLFTQKALAAGFDLGYEDSVTVYHPARSTLSEHIEKSIRIGRGFVQANRIAPGYFSTRSIFHPRNFLPPDPWYFRARYDLSDVTYLEAIFVWLFSWLLNLCETYGRFREILWPTDPTT